MGPRNLNRFEDSGGSRKGEDLMPTWWLEFRAFQVSIRKSIAGGRPGVTYQRGNKIYPTPAEELRRGLGFIAEFPKKGGSRKSSNLKDEAAKNWRSPNFTFMHPNWRVKSVREKTSFLEGLLSCGPA